MFHELTDPAEGTADDLYERYLKSIVDVLERCGIDTAAERTELDRGTLEAIVDGESPEITLEAGASVLALDEEAPDAATIATLARDELLMGMTTAVLDVEAVASGLEGELEAREIQSKIEGRFPMTLREFALLHRYIGGRQ